MVAEVGQVVVEGEVEEVGKKGPRGLAEEEEHEEEHNQQHKS